jgi:hypothetical protein
MGSRTRPDCYEQATQPLRLRSPELLLSTLAAYLRGAGPEIEADWRDVLVSLAPYHDCAVRIGMDPILLFDVASTGQPDAIRDLAMTFARRSDITLENFGWVMRDTPAGPCYQSAEWTSWKRWSRPLPPT